LALSVPPWEPLHELSAVELRTANIVMDDAVAAKDAPAPEAAKTVAVSGKAIQDRVAADVMPPAPPVQIMKSTKTAEALPPTGGAAVATPEH